MKIMITKRLLSIAMALMSFGAADAQKKSAAAAVPSDLSKDKLFEHYKTVYDLAYRYSDFAVAREAIYNMISLKPERTGLKDTLTYLYYGGGDYFQVILLGKEILGSQPDKADILELVAVSQQNRGLLKDALESFEKLFAITKDVYHLYNVASLQYMLKRFGECSESLNTIIASTDTVGEVTISDNAGQSQKVPLKAAAFNMRGVIALEINQQDVAMQNFQKALELFPDFILAKSNLDKTSAQNKKSEPEKKK